MKAQLIIDGADINPEFNPPQRAEFIGLHAAEEYADAKATYAVPREILRPCGLVIAGEHAWRHCFPDQSGIAFRFGSGGNVEPYRKAPGIVRCIPFDDACKTEFAAQAALMARSRGVPLQTVLDEVAAGVARSRALQAEAESARAVAPIAPATPAAPTAAAGSV